MFILFSSVAGIGILAYLRASLAVATVASLLGLLVLTNITSGILATVVITGAWLTWLGVASLNLRELRYRFISRPGLSYFRNALPTVSQTERDALDAGSVWWDAELFSGDPKWSRLLDVAAPRLTADEQAFLDGPVSNLCAMLDEWGISRAGDLPAEVWQYLKDQGFLGMIALRSGTAAVSVIVPHSLGPAELLLRYGNEARKEHYLPRRACGDEIPCFALTNPFAGSDAAAIPDSGVVCRCVFEGEDVLGICVTWEKRCITLSPIATVVGLAFHIFDPNAAATVGVS